MVVRAIHKACVAKKNVDAERVGGTEARAVKKYARSGSDFNKRYMRFQNTNIET